MPLTKRQVERFPFERQLGEIWKALRNKGTNPGGDGRVFEELLPSQQIAEIWEAVKDLDTGASDDAILFTEDQSLTIAQQTQARENIRFNLTNPIAAALGIKDFAAETVMVSRLRNRSEGTYGATQTFGTTFWNPVLSLWFVVANTGTACFLYKSHDGLNWSNGILIDQNTHGATCVAANCDSNGYIYCIVTNYSGTEASAVSTIKKSTDEGVTWADTEIKTAVSSVSPNVNFISATHPPMEFSGMEQIGDGRMVSCYASDPLGLAQTVGASGLFYFNPASPATQSHLSLGLDFATEIGLHYDSDEGVLFGLSRTDDRAPVSTPPIYILKLVAGSGSTWTTFTLTALSSLNPVLYHGNQFSLTRIGENYIASLTVRNTGAEHIFICPAADVIAGIDSWVPYRIGTSSYADTTAGHFVNGSGGIAFDGDHTIIRTFGAGFGYQGLDDSDLFVTRFDLDPPTDEIPLIKVSEAMINRTLNQPVRTLFDNQESDIQSAKYQVSVNTGYVCLGRGVIFLSPTANIGDTIIFVKSASPLIFVRGSGDIYKWTDGVTYSSGSSLSDDSDKVRVYTVRCIATQTWLFECAAASIEYLISILAMSADLTRTDTIMPRIDILSGRNMFFRREEFTGGRSTTGTIGENSWATSGTGAIVPYDTIFDHPGVLKVTSGTSTNDLRDVTDTDTWWVRDVIAAYTTKWFFEWVFYLPSVSDVNFFIGCERSSGSHVAGLELNTTAGNTSFKSWTHNGATSTKTDIGTAIAATWYRLEVYETTALTITFNLTRLDTGAVVGTNNHTTNLPASDQRMAARIQTLTTAAKTMWIDLCNVAIWGLTR